MIKKIDTIYMRRGFTLIEFIITLALIIIVAALGLLILRPSDELARARNNERQAHLNAILNAIGQNIADHNGTFSCSTGALPTATTTMADNNPVVGDYNVAPCLVSAYLPSLPFDPATTTASYVSVSDYNTAYTVIRNLTTGRVRLSAPGAELGVTISVTR